MTQSLDQLIDERKLAREGKDFKRSDEIRQILDDNLIFVFDAPWGQEIYYLTEKYFVKKPITITNRQFVEIRLKEDVRLEKVFSAWLYSVTTQGRLNNLTN